LAKRVLREWRCGLLWQEPPGPSSRTATDRVLEKKIQTKDEVLAELMAEHIALKKSLGELLTKVWVPHDVRDWWWISSGAGRKKPRSGRTIHPLAGRASQQILRLARALWARQ